MADQTERSFQKQPTVFLNRKKGIGVKRSRKPLRYHKDTEKAFQKQTTIFLNRKGVMKKKDMRHHKNVGLGFKTPREVWLVSPRKVLHGGGFVANRRINLQNC